jgi:hypothetical protein
VQVLSHEVSFNIVIQDDQDSCAADLKDIDIVHLAFVHEACEHVRGESQHVENEMLEMRGCEV